MTLNSITLWLAVGFLGQLIFAARFLIQWLYAEKHRKSLIPIPFWYLSILGAIILFSYAVHRRDPVFIMGQGLGIIVYLRNLYFIRLENRKNRSIEQDLSPANEQSKLI